MQRLLASFRGKPEEQALKIGLLKSLKRAVTLSSRSAISVWRKITTRISPARSAVTPISSCIARWPIASDQDASRGDSAGELAGIAEHISTTERVAAEAENRSGQDEEAGVSPAPVDGRNPQVFRAVVIDVRNYGLLIELPDVLLTGLFMSRRSTTISIRSRRAQRRLIGRQSRRRFAVGDVLHVFVARIDLQTPG